MRTTSDSYWVVVMSSVASDKSERLACAAVKGGDC